MWLLYSFIAAVFYAALWVLTRAGKKLPTSLVLASQFWLGPLLLFNIPETPIPWHATALWIWIIVVLFIVPGVLWAMTYASQNAHVSIIKPLSGLSGISALLTGMVVFGEEISMYGFLAVLIVTLGLLVLYRGRSYHWRSLPPWIVLCGVLFFGVNAAVTRNLLLIFPEPFFLAGVFFTESAIIWTTVSIVRGNFSNIRRPDRILFLSLAVASVVQDVATGLAMTLAPAAYVLTAKRISILLASLVAFFYFHEKEIPLWRLVLGSIIVISGTAVLAMIH